jgi:hypothetical protein
MPLIDVAVAIVVVALIGWLVNARVPLPAPITRIVNVMLGLIVIGIVLWVVNTYVPMAQSIKGLLNVVVFIASLVWVLEAFGLWNRVVELWNRFTSRRIAPAGHYGEPRHPETYQG